MRAYIYLAIKYHLSTLRPREEPSLTSKVVVAVVLLSTQYSNPILCHRNICHVGFFSPTRAHSYNACRLHVAILGTILFYFTTQLRPDITVMVGWALKIHYLSMYLLCFMHILNLIYFAQKVFPSSIMIVIGFGSCSLF